MIRKVLAFSGRKTLLAILALLVIAGVGWFVYQTKIKNTSSSPQYPEYLSFAGNYVFTVPANYVVDDTARPGAELVYSGTLSAKTLEEVYTAGGISVEPVKDLADTNSKSFKSFVNDTFLPDIKANISSDVEVKFAKVRGWDTAQVAVSKDGQPIRFYYLKNGQHPAVIVASRESGALKKIAQTLTDVETSDLATEPEPIKTLIRTTGQLIKDQKAREIYLSSTSELQAKNSEAELVSALRSAATYTKQNTTVNGGLYDGDGFSVTLIFGASTAKDAPPPTFGTLQFSKFEDLWKLNGLTLPSPTPPTEGANKKLP